MFDLRALKKSNSNSVVGLTESQMNRRFSCRCEFSLKLFSSTVALSLRKTYLARAWKRKRQGICDQTEFKLKVTPRQSTWRLINQRDQSQAEEGQRNERGWMRASALMNKSTHEPASWLTGLVYLLMQLTSEVHSPSLTSLSSLASRKGRWEGGNGGPKGRVVGCSCRWAGKDVGVGLDWRLEERWREFLATLFGFAGILVSKEATCLSFLTESFPSVPPFPLIFSLFSSASLSKEGCKMEASDALNWRTSAEGFCLSEEYWKRGGVPTEDNLTLGVSLVKQQWGSVQ